jgi:AcrR family transcriptional regulator
MWNRLLEAFVVVLAEKGYPGLTLADVARHAGMARNSIYRYAPDKQALREHQRRRASFRRRLVRPLIQTGTGPPTERPLRPE